MDTGIDSDPGRIDFLGPQASAPVRISDGNEQEIVRGRNCCGKIQANWLIHRFMLPLDPSLPVDANAKELKSLLKQS